MTSQITFRKKCVNLSKSYVAEQNVMIVILSKMQIFKQINIPGFSLELTFK